MKEKHTNIHCVHFPSASHSTSMILIVFRVSGFVCLHVFSLVRDDLEDQVVQQCELLSYLQGRVALKRFSLTVLHGLTHTHRVKSIITAEALIIYRWGQSFQEEFYYSDKVFCNFLLTICVISSKVTWLSPGSSWVRVLHIKTHKHHHLAVWSEITKTLIDKWIWPHEKCQTSHWVLILCLCCLG